MKKPSPQLIIDRPDLMTWRQRAMFGALTAAFWIVWFALWLPVVTMAGWLFFGLRFQRHMHQLEGYHGFLGLVGAYALVIMAMGGSLLLWAKYNHLRFRGVDRRRDFPVPAPAAIAQSFGLSEELICSARQHQVMTVHHDDHGAIVRIEDRAAAREARVKAVVAEARSLAATH